jgi:hypothetical protein
LAAISKVAGVDLVPVWEYDIGNTNISIPNPYDDRWSEQNTDNLDETSASLWHKDCVSFVCVIMLSDCTGMVGGETALRTASGEVLKVRGPAMIRLPGPKAHDITA